MKKLPVVMILICCVFASVSHSVPVAHWKLDGDGTDSANANNGIVYGGSWVEGAIDQAFATNGNSYIDLGTNPNIKLDMPLTITAWINLSQLDTHHRILGLGDNSSGYRGVWFKVYNTNVLEISFGDGSGSNQNYRRAKFGTVELSSDTWYHVAAVVRGAQDMDLYINGVEDPGIYDGSGGELFYGNGSSAIAKVVGAESYLQGAIDDVRLFDDTLTQQEIIATIPEPASIVLFMIAGVSILSSRKK